jgi:hypothetical protein
MIITTSTLTTGVNVPSVRDVAIPAPYSGLELSQAIGRCGRGKLFEPGFAFVLGTVIPKHDDVIKSITAAPEHAHKQIISWCILRLSKCNSLPPHKNEGRFSWASDDWAAFFDGVPFMTESIQWRAVFGEQVAMLRDELRLISVDPRGYITTQGSPTLLSVCEADSDFPLVLRDITTCLRSDLVGWTQTSPIVPLFQCLAYWLSRRDSLPKLTLRKRTLEDHRPTSDARRESIYILLPLYLHTRMDFPTPLEAFHLLTGLMNRATFISRLLPCHETWRRQRIALLATAQAYACVGTMVEWWNHVARTDLATVIVEASRYGDALSEVATQVLQADNKWVGLLQSSSAMLDYARDIAIDIRSTNKRNISEFTSSAPHPLALFMAARLKISPDTPYNVANTQLRELGLVPPTWATIPQGYTQEDRDICMFNRNWRTLISQPSPDGSGTLIASDVDYYDA